MEGTIKIGKRQIYCSEHLEHAMSMVYDAWFCPVCFRWLEPECSCSWADYEAGRCHVPKPRPVTAEGLAGESYEKADEIRDEGA